MPDAVESATPRDRREEANLVRRACRGERGAMRALVDGHQQRLFAFVWRMVRNHHDAEELCQEAFLKAFAALNSFDPAYRFSTWLFTIAYRLTLNVARKKRPLSADLDFSALAGATEGADAGIAASEEARQLKGLVWEAVDELSPPQRAAVLLFYKQQLSCQEIAEVLETPVATVKSHLHRGRKRLRTLLEASLSDDTDRSRILGEWAG